jgi:uncharacterized protein
MSRGLRIFLTLVLASLTAPALAAPFVAPLLPSPDSAKPLPFRTSRNRKLVVIHHTDNDGFASRWVVHHWLAEQKRLGRPVPKEVQYCWAGYGSAPPEGIDKRCDVCILDFSYPREQLEQLKRCAHSLIVLDHHESAKKALGDLPYCHFDTKESGATLTWKEFFPRKRMPGLIAYVKDYDLWTFKLPGSKEINATISSYPMQEKDWDKLYKKLRCEPSTPKNVRKDLLAQGKAILGYSDKLVEQATAGAVDIDFGGHRVPAVNSTLLTSEIAGRLAQGKPFGIVWLAKKDGRWAYELRSRAGGLDVSEIARAAGGGGHPAAAGATLDAPPRPAVPPSAELLAATIARIRATPPLPEGLSQPQIAAIGRSQQRRLEAALRSAVTVQLDGAPTLAVNAGQMTDEIARQLRGKARAEGKGDRGVAWAGLPDGRFLYTIADAAGVRTELRDSPLR